MRWQDIAREKPLDDPVDRADRLTQQNSPSVDTLGGVRRSIDLERLQSRLEPYLTVLDPQERELLHLIYWEGKTLGVLARDFGDPKHGLAWVRGVLASAVRKLRRATHGDRQLRQFFDHPVERDVDEADSPWHQDSRHSPEEEAEILGYLESKLAHEYAPRDRVKLRQLIKIVNQRGIEGAVRYWQDKVRSRYLNNTLANYFRNFGYDRYGTHRDDPEHTLNQP